MGVLPVRYDIIYIYKSIDIRLTGRGRPYVFSPLRYESHLHTKSKAIPVTGLESPQGCEMLRMPHCPVNRIRDGGEVVGLTHGRALLPSDISGTILF
jgi:hypothetical protein